MSTRVDVPSHQIVRALTEFVARKVEQGYPAETLSRSFIMAGIGLGIRTMGFAGMAQWLQGQVNYLQHMAEMHSPSDHADAA